MFGIGSTELLLILVVALIVLGPKNLPKLANTLGKAMGQFQKASRDFQRTINTEIALDEEQERKKQETQSSPAQAPVQNSAEETKKTEPVQNSSADTTKA